ncbi:MAG: hypothetical protein KQH63_13400 [Desulfobulbaceae bacterium]|nr:hypothetical protein [Desulfobulbaceae bacterium]
MFDLGISCREVDFSPKDTVFSKTDEKTDTGDKGVVYRCRHCRARITTAGQMIEMNGSHRHTFANPYGKVFGIGCFSIAPGCVTYGPPTKDCTWFTGCSWRYSMCATCRVHLGWKYQSDLSGSFYGLIMSELVTD